jgi:ParB/RepB/Spo0J family partition protein
MNSVEIEQIDKRFESFRLQDKDREGALLRSIVEQGIRDPLGCVVTNENAFILLDGFKRYRSAVRLKLNRVPYVRVAEDEVSGILQLIRQSNNKSLHLLEQAQLVDELKRTHGLSVSGIAEQLERSPAWVSVRLGLLSEMSEPVKREIFAGRFPVRSYMYKLRELTRVNKSSTAEVNEFVRSVAGKRLSSRNIDRLAYGYFRGGSRFKEQIRKGNIAWTLDQLKGCSTSESAEVSGLSQLEQRVICDLEIMQKYMGKVLHGIKDPSLKNSSFFMQAHLLVEGILGRIDVFIKTLRRFCAVEQISSEDKPL